MDKKAELEMAVKMTEVVFAGIAKLIEVVSEAERKALELKLNYIKESGLKPELHVNIDV